MSWPVSPSIPKEDTQYHSYLDERMNSWKGNVAKIINWPSKIVSSCMKILVSSINVEHVLKEIKLKIDER